MTNLYPTWQYERSFELSGSVASGDQILVAVDYQDSAGIPMAVDFADLRFSDGTNQLVYWLIPGYTVSEDSCLCVVALQGTATTLYMYWGNESATSESTISACENGWIFTGTTLPSGWSGTGTVADGAVSVAGLNVVQTSATFTRGYELITRMKTTAGGSAEGFGTSAPWLLINANTGAGYYQIGAGATVVNTQVTFDPNYHNFRLKYLATALLYADDYSAVSLSTSIPDTALPVAIFGSSSGGLIYVTYVALRKMPSGGDVTTTWGTITDTFAVAPTADFSGTPLTGTAPLQVQFTDSSVGVVTSWLWSFGDGQTSTEQNPLHRYTSAGSYTVSLTATNTIGYDAESKTDYVVVSETGSAPVAAFSGTPLAGAAPLAIQFADGSTGTPTSWSWAFGDGETSTDQNPYHAYLEEGTYDVTLTVTNGSGTNVWKKVDYVTVTFPVSTAYPVRINPSYHLRGGTRSHPFNIISSDGSLMSTCTNPVIKMSKNGADEITESWAISSFNSSMMRFLMTVIDTEPWTGGDNIEISVQCDEGLGFLSLIVFLPPVIPHILTFNSTELDSKLSSI